MWEVQVDLRVKWILQRIMDFMGNCICDNLPLRKASSKIYVYFLQNLLKIDFLEFLQGLKQVDF